MDSPVKTATAKKAEMEEKHAYLQRDMIPVLKVVLASFDIELDQTHTFPYFGEVMLVARQNELLEKALLAGEQAVLIRRALNEFIEGFPDAEKIKIGVTHFYSVTFTVDEGNIRDSRHLLQELVHFLIQRYELEADDLELEDQRATRCKLPLELILLADILQMGACEEINTHIDSFSWGRGTQTSCWLRFESPDVDGRFNLTPDPRETNAVEFAMDLLKSYYTKFKPVSTRSQLIMTKDGHDLKIVPQASVVTRFLRQPEYNAVRWEIVDECYQEWTQFVDFLNTE